MTSAHPCPLCFGHWTACEAGVLMCACCSNIEELCEHRVALSRCWPLRANQARAIADRDRRLT